MLYYTVYKTTNTVNQKVYIGMHQTKNLYDDYLGSGSALKADIAKYGKQNFVKEILHILDSEEEMRETEKRLVTEEFIANHYSYNLLIGGKGGFQYINKNGIGGFSGTHSEETKKKLSILAMGRRLSAETKSRIGQKSRDNNTIQYVGEARRLPKSEVTKRRISDSLKRYHEQTSTPYSNMAVARAARTFSDSWKENVKGAMKFVWAEGGARYHERLCVNYEEVQKDLLNGLKPKQIRAKYGMSKNQYDNALKRGYIKRGEG